jgi:hypothetical protein
MARRVDPGLAVCGVRTRWEGTLEQNKGKRAGTTMLVVIAEAGSPNAGQILRQSEPQLGRYVMGEDEALTLVAEADGLYAEERLWFASPNLRLRTSVVKQAGGISTASFCSEIRMGGAPAQ